MTRREDEARREGLILAKVITVAAAVVAAGSIATFEINSLQYGWVLFLVVPYFIGFFSTTVLRFFGPQTARKCYAVSSVVGLLLALGFLVFGKEGIICIAMAMPIALPLILLGAHNAYALLHERSLLNASGTSVVLLAAVALCMYVERRLPLPSPTFTVTDSITIAAPPDVVWNDLISMGSLGQPRDWIFRLGVACPQRVDIFGRGEGAMRVCTLSTGLLQERINVWEPGRRLRWTSISTPAPLKELNPFRDADPPHLHGFYRSVGGEFELTAAGAGTTRITRRSSYQHHMFPAWYWRIWCDYVARRGHLYVLGVLKDTVERRRPRPDLQARQN